MFTSTTPWYRHGMRGLQQVAMAILMPLGLPMVRNILLEI
jgi:hypothetical protein